ncbi:MAG: outer membrane receptor for ferrienterochelin and colicins [Oleispira sp.]|jgi:outer membrane receptor for ferrienterochelin and colicins
MHLSMNILRPHSFLLISLMAAFSARSETVQLDTQEVTAHGQHYARLSEQPVRVELIDRAAIEESHALNLADALRYTAGVQLKPITGKPGLGVWLQGYDSDRVAILIDGNPVAAGTGSSVDISQIAIGDVERIEISKGSMSAIYGTSAMGGVVNVITRQPEQGARAGLKYIGGSWGDQDLPYDSIPFGKQHLNLNFSHANKVNAFQIVSDNQISSGFRAPDTKESQGWEGYKSNLSIRNVTQITPTISLLLAPRLYREDVKTNKDNFVGGIGNVPQDKIDLTEKNALMAVLEKDNGELGALKLSYSHEDYKNESLQDLVSTPHIEQNRITDIQHNGLTAQYSYTHQYTSHYVLGIEALEDEMDATSHKNDGTTKTITTEVDGKKLNNHNGFFQISQQASTTLEFLASGRINNNDKYGTKFSPMLNLQYMPTLTGNNHLNLRLGAGHGYRTPTLKELYHFFDHSHIGYVLLGNEALEPESSINVQASLEYSNNNDLSFDMSIYRNDIKNLIDFYVDQDKTNQLTSQYGDEVVANVYGNIDRAQTSGFEFSIAYDVNTWLTTNLGYAYLDAINKSTGKSLTRRPEHDVKTSLDFYLNHKNKLALKYQYYSKQFSDSENTLVTPAYSEVDLKWNYYPSESINLFAGINNLTNSQRDFSTGSDLRPEAGRYVYLGIELTKLAF